MASKMNPSAIRIVGMTYNLEALAPLEPDHTSVVWSSSKGQESPPRIDWLRGRCLLCEIRAGISPGGAGLAEIWRQWSWTATCITAHSWTAFQMRVPVQAGRYSSAGPPALPWSGEEAVSNLGVYTVWSRHPVIRWRPKRPEISYRVSCHTRNSYVITCHISVSVSIT